MPARQAAATPHVPVLDIAAVLTMLAVFSLTTGYTYPAVAFNLEARGFSASLIGAQAALAGAGILAGSLATPHLAARFGAWRMAVIGLYGTVAIVAAFGLVESLPVWFVLRFALGAMVAILFIVSETWINLLAPDAMRGRIVSIYAATNAGLFAVGPMLVPLIGYSGLSSFGVMALVVACMGIALIRLRHVEGPMETAPFGLSLSVMAAIPVLLAAVAAFGFLDGAALSLWVVFAFDRGLSEPDAALSLSAMIIGNVVLQFPIGWLADRMSRRLLLALLAAGGFVGAALLPFVPLTSWWGIAYLVVWGAVAFGVYTLSLTLIGQHLMGIRLVAATAGFGIAWGAGALAGPWIAGTAMDLFGPGTLPFVIAAVYLALTLATLAMSPVRQSLGRLG